MFVYSVRASSVRIGALVILLALLMSALIFTGRDNVVSAWGSGEVDYSGIKSKEDRIAFINRFGISVEEGSEENAAFRMPDDFDRVILGYNELQKKQGLDLSKYKNKRVTRYTYKVTNYESDGEVFANLFVHRGKIVACDICSADPEGFITPLTMVNRDNLK